MYDVQRTSAEATQREVENRTPRRMLFSFAPNTREPRMTHNRTIAASPPSTTQDGDAVNVELTPPRTGVVLVSVTREIDMASHGPWSGCLLGVLDAPAPARLVADLTPITSFGCTAINTPVRVRQKAARTRRCRHRIVHLSRPRPADDLNNAVDRFSAGSPGASNRPSIELLTESTTGRPFCAINTSARTSTPEGNGRGDLERRLPRVWQAPVVMTTPLRTAMVMIHRPVEASRGAANCPHHPGLQRGAQAGHRSTAPQATDAA